MSRLIAAILLSILLFPVGAILYLLVFFVAVETRWFGRVNDAMAFLVAGIVTSVFVAGYWVMVWRKTVHWNARRITRTGSLGGAAVLAGIVLGMAAGSLERDFGYFIGSIAPPLVWMVATVLVWRETDAERSQRLLAQARRGDGPAVPCPTCSYDMTGLRGTRCPECGSEFTVDELLTSLPGKAAAELER